MGKTKEISVFVDESGSYDPDETSSLYYMVCLVFHDQDSDISREILKLEEAFAAITVKTEFVPEVTPAKYRLFQAADFICTLELMRMRIAEGKGLNKSEIAFFGNARLFKRNVLAQLSGKDF